MNCRSSRSISTGGAFSIQWLLGSRSRSPGLQQEPGLSDLRPTGDAEKNVIDYNASPNLRSSAGGCSVRGLATEHFAGQQNTAACGPRR